MISSSELRQRALALRAQGSRVRQHAPSFADADQQRLVDYAAECERQAAELEALADEIDRRSR